MRIPFTEMQQEIKRVFIKHGLTEQQAETCARVHAESSRDGIYSHGTNRVARFVDYVGRGWVNLQGVPTLEKQFGALATYNGNLGPGITNALFAADKAMELAKQNGIGMVGLRNTTHWMRGGTYGLYAAEKGYVAISWTNTESCMPPWGGVEGRLGNNPFVMAAPYKNNPVLLDMAMSQYAYGKLQVTRLAGKKLPLPGGFDAAGHLTDDPGAIEQTKRILPMGYWKGASFAFMLDILGAVLADGDAASTIDNLGKGSCGGASQVFIMVDPAHITNAARRDEIIQQAIEYIKSSPLDETAKDIRYPGEGYLRYRAESDVKGVFVDDTVWQEIMAL